MAVQIPVRQDAQTQLAIQQLEQELIATQKKLLLIKSGVTVTSSSSPSSTTVQVPITENFSYAAGVFLYSAVYESASGRVSLADPATLATAAEIGIVVAINSTKVSVCTFGSVTNSAWNWTPNEPVYLAAGGQLSQSVPPDGLTVIVGYAISSHKIRIGVEAALAQNWAPGGYYDIAAGSFQVIPAGQIAFTMGALHNDGVLVNNGRLASI